MKWPKVGVPGNGLLGREGISGFAKCASDIGKCSVSFFNSPIDLSKSNYQVIDTDYNNYAIVYGCDDWFFSYTREVWLLSRTPRLDQKYIDYAKSVIEKKVGKDSGAKDYYNLNRWIET